MTHVSTQARVFRANMANAVVITLPSGAEPVASWQNAAGAVEIVRFRHSVAYLRMVGHADQPAGKVIERALAQIFAASAALHTFWDLHELAHAHADVRKCSLNALVADRRKLASVHTFSASRLWAVGMSVANLALGALLHNHRTAAGFELALHAALPN